MRAVRGSCDAELLVDEERQAVLLGPWNGFALSASKPTAVTISAAVSPTARATPEQHRGDQARLRAVGSTTLHVVRHSVAPSASDASRRPSGTSRSTSSDVRVIVGSIRIESASAAAKPEKPSRARIQTA